MPAELQRLLDSLSKAPLRTKAAVAASALALVAAISIAGVLANRPHFVPLYSGLDDSERVAVEKALAGSGVRYRVSDFPGPFVLYVDEGAYDEAQTAVALAEALEPARRGIDSGDAGASTIFMSAAERAQSVLKRDWQEAERLLEELDFVASAIVTTSTPDPSPLRRREPPMVSVALALRGARELTHEEAQNVAKLVRFRFGVPAENVVISDQSGRLLYDPTASEDDSAGARELMEHAASYERELAAKANAHVEQAFGRRKALVAIASRWNFDQSTTVDESVDPETVAMSTEVRSTSTPQPAEPRVGGPAGVASNVAPDPNAAAPATSPTAAGSTAAATTRDEKKVFDASRKRVQTVHAAPQLERLFVSLVVDESLAAKKDEIRAVVEAAVGFDAQRRDVIGVSVSAIAAEPPPPADAAGAIAADEGGGPSFGVLLERGVEIAAAVAFVVLLALSLRGARKAAAGARDARQGSASPAEGEVDPEALARVQIEELVRSDPRRVGEILSRWIEDKSPAGVGP